MVSRSSFRSALALLVSSTLHLQNVAAQVTTDCQPLNTTGCPADPAFGMDFNFNFNSTPPSDTWATTVGPVQYDGKNGATFTINKQGDSPTIRSVFYIFFGRVEVMMKAATGTGIISSVMLLSDDLDEIDWEFMGGNSTHAETNYFGKGQQNFGNAIYYPVRGGINSDYHNYTTVWTQSALDFYIDGQKVRTLLPKDANNSALYPQTPMRISLGIWAGGDPSLPKGTREWAGGDTDYSKGPFSMMVKSAQVTDFHSGKEYSYGDNSGSWQSIKVVTGNSTAHDSIHAPPAQSIGDKWNNLSPVARIAIYASAAGIGTAFLAFALYYCIKKRRQGAKEAKAAEQRAIQERMELDQFKKAGIDPDSFIVANSEYNAKDMRADGMSSKDAYSVPQTPSSPANEKTWDTGYFAGAGAAGAGAGAVSGMRSPAPLMENRAPSPRIASPGLGLAPYRDAPERMGSPAQHHAQVVSPIRSPGPGMPPSFPPPASPVGGGNYGNNNMRSFSQPNAHMRAGSPGPQMGGYGGGGISRTQSPAQMAPQQQPQRSFTGPGAGGYGGQGMGGQQGGQRGYGGGGYGGQGGQRGYGGQGGQGGQYWR